MADFCTRQKEKFIKLKTGQTVNSALLRNASKQDMFKLLRIFFYFIELM